MSRLDWLSDRIYGTQRVHKMVHKGTQLKPYHQLIPTPINLLFALVVIPIYGNDLLEQVWL